MEAGPPVVNVIGCRVVEFGQKKRAVFILRRIKWRSGYRRIDHRAGPITARGPLVLLAELANSRNSWQSIYARLIAIAWHLYGRMDEKKIYWKCATKAQWQNVDLRLTWSWRRGFRPQAVRRNFPWRVLATRQIDSVLTIVRQSLRFNIPQNLVWLSGICG